MTPEAMTVGEVAHRFGLATSALRYYERRGLLHPGRDAARRRIYRRQDLRTLAFVLLCRDGGLRLDEIAIVLGAPAPDRRTWQSVVRDRITALDEQIARLQTAREQLQQAQRCPSDHPASNVPMRKSTSNASCTTSYGRHHSRLLSSRRAVSAT